MNLKRAATFGLLGGVLAAMLAGAATSGRRPPIVLPIEKPTTADVSGAELAAEIARLRERLRPTATPQQMRNLFEFSRPRASRAAPRATEAAEGPTPASAAVASPSPLTAMKLIGLAEEQGPDGPMRTAILTAFGELLLVKEGETVARRYRVAKISGEAVELVDVSDDTALRLTLK
jgi:hypothetical protein